MTLDGKVALISGGARGIGAAAARRFITVGARVVITDINDAAGAATSETLGPDCLFVPGDHTDNKDNAAAVARALDHWGTLDILFCNAGRGSSGTIEGIDDQHLQDDLDSHVVGPARLVRAALPALKASAAAGRGAAIVITASRASLKVRPNTATYAIAKHATLGLMRSLAADLGPYGIRVNAICPGMVDTDLSRAMSAAYGNNADEVFARFAAESPLGRLATADEVADTVMFLASDQARAVHSQALVVDCGTHGI